MKLYTFDLAPNARRLQLFLNYKGIELETQQIDLGSLEQHGEEYAVLRHRPVGGLGHAQGS